MAQIGGLLIPDHIARKVRPYAAVPLQDLLQELQIRGDLHELTVEEALPLPDQLTNLLAEQIDALRLSTFTHMLQQVVGALGRSSLLFTGSGYKPPMLPEFLVLKLLVVRHPMRPQPVEEPALIPEGGA